MQRGLSTSHILLTVTGLLVVLFLAVSYDGNPTGLQVFEPQVTFLNAGDCGDSLNIANEEYELTADLNCTVNALTIAASGITLNCAGFSIFTETQSNTLTAINVPTTQHGYTIENCNISGFQIGISVNGFSQNVTINNNTFYNMSSINTPIGITGGSDAVNVTITRNNITRALDDAGVQGSGISMGGNNAGFFYIAHNYVQSVGQVGIGINAANLTVYNNTFFNNSLPGGNVNALSVSLRDNVLVSTNTFFNNSDQAIGVSPVAVNGNNFTIFNNTINNSGKYGVKFDSDAGDSNVYIINNIIRSSNRDNVDFGDAGLFVDNAVTGTIANNTIDFTRGDGIRLENSNNIIVSANNITNNSPSGINFSNTNSNITIERNMLAYNDAHGVFADSADSTLTNIFIIGNNASFNNESGFYLDSLGVVEFRDNIANNNRGADSGADLGPRAAAAPECVQGAACEDDEDCGGGAFGGFGTCQQPESFPGFFTPQQGTCDCGVVFTLALVNANLNFSNNTAMNNNGTGFNITGYNTSNFVNSTAMNNSGVGFYVQNVFSSFFEGIVSVNNSGEGIRLFNGSNNTITSSYLASDFDKAIAFIHGGNNSLEETTLSSGREWVELLTSDGNNFTNVTLNDTFGSVRAIALVTADNTSVINRTYLNFTQGRIFLNATNLTYLNVSSHIQLRNVDSTEVQVAFNDTDFVTCSAPQCTNIVAASGNVDFDVASFTTYLVQNGTIAFELEKSDSPDPVSPGAQLQYTITITVSNGTLFNATVGETYPAQVTFDSSSPTPSAGNNTFTLGNLTPGTYTINITVNVSSAATGTLTNTINLTFQNLSNYMFVFNETETTTIAVSAAGGASSGGSGGSSSAICPPSCMSLTPEQRARSKYCQERCVIETEAPQPEVQKSAPTSQGVKPAEPQVQTEQTTIPPHVEEEPKLVKEPQIINQTPVEKEFKILTYLFYGIALIALVGLWFYTHNKHLKHIK